MSRKVEIKFTGNADAITRAARAIQGFNDAMERSYRRQRRLRFGGTRRHRAARLWWRLYYRWCDWRWQRRNPSLAHPQP